MTPWEQSAAQFNQSATCRRRRDSKPRVKYEPGCLRIGCEHPSCACATNLHGDEAPTLAEILEKWRAMHG